MRKYRNISESELAELGAVHEWDLSVATILKPGAKLLWVHNHRKRYTPRTDNQCLIRTVKVVKVDDYNITTNFGKHSLETGQNIHCACGCMRFCDCYGRLYLPKERHTLQSKVPV